jgi:ribulose-phosphate 3-epimerase
MARLSPSILSSDFYRLGEEISILEKGGADLLHLDVMDGHFVPSITIGPAVVKSLAGKTKLPFDIHLMVNEPELMLEDFVTENTEYLVVHYEACPHLDRVLKTIKSLGVKCGVALNPATHPILLDYVLELADQILIMTVNPGMGGQSLITGALEKIKYLNALRRECGYEYEIAIDGGVSLDNMAGIIDDGADIIIIGSAIAHASDPLSAVRAFGEIAGRSFNADCK